MPNLLKIEHAPLGLEHPYQQEPTERSPRQPIAGQALTLGLATWPAGAAERTWAEWRTGGSAFRAAGSPAGLDGERSVWKVELPAFAALEQVTYRLFAAGGGSELNTPEFSFTAAAWAPCAAPGAVCLLQAQNRAGERGEGQSSPFAGEVQVEFTGAGQAAGLALHFVKPDRLHLRWQAGSGALPQAPGGLPFQVTARNEAGLTLESAALRVELGLRPFRLAVYRRADGQMLFEQDQAPAWLLGADRRPLQLRFDFPCPPEESFYGFGERFNALNQRGSRLEALVYEQYKNQGLKTYIPVPFCFSPRGWGLYLNTARRVDYDLAAADPQRWSFSAGIGPAAALEYDLFFGPPAALIGEYTEITGRPALPPAWVFGPWMSGNEWNSQAEVLRQVELTRQHRIPASVLVIEAWSDEATFYIWNGARYNLKPGGEAFRYSDFTFPPEGLWPDPKGMTEELHRQGIHLVLWQIPVEKKMEQAAIRQAAQEGQNLDELFGGPPGPAETLRVAQRDLDEAHMLEQGYHLKLAGGEPYRVRPFWFHDSLLWDPTNPAGAEWWLGKRAYLLDEVGVDGFKTDGGEHLWGSGVRFHNGLDGDEGINLYPNLYAGAYYQFANRRRPGQAVTFSRAGFSGAQAFPCHWAGDENSTWAAFRASLMAGLNAGLCGIPFWGWDIGGFSGEIPSAELYLRAAGMAALCPIMQYHAEYNGHRLPSRDRTPWNIAERSGRPEVIAIYRKFANLRQGLLPYIEAEAAHSAASGEPLMRPLFLDWPEDPQAWQVSDQYCFGRALLVAPILEEGCLERRLYLPAGEWLDVWAGMRLSGPGWITCPAGWDRIPVYQRLGLDGPPAQVWTVEEDHHA